MSEFKFNFDFVIDDLSNSIAYLSNDYTSLKVFFDFEDGCVTVREANVFAVLYTDGTDDSELLTQVKYNKEFHFAIERVIQEYLKD